MKEQTVRLTVIATNRHCSNDCPGMKPDASWCLYFERPLTWDVKRAYNGNKRLKVCKEAANAD